MSEESIITVLGMLSGVLLVITIFSFYLLNGKNEEIGMQDLRYLTLVTKYDQLSGKHKALTREKKELREELNTLHADFAEMQE
jgi:hypothetical protein